MDSAASNGPPWASMFDSVANMRALTAIQAEGFRAASKLVDRFVEVAATGRDAPGAGPAAPPLTEEQRANLWGATDVEPLISSWWSMVNQLVFGYPAAVSSTPAAAGAPVGPAALDLAGAVAALEGLRLRGLMTIGANSPDAAVVAGCFDRLAALRDRLNADPRIGGTRFTG